MPGEDRGLTSNSARSLGFPIPPPAPSQRQGGRLKGRKGKEHGPLIAKEVCWGEGVSGMWWQVVAEGGEGLVGKGKTWEKEA